jgi:hypothetical protein
MKLTREEIIMGMCYTFRHDYGLDKGDGEGFADQLSAGTTKTEREFIYRQMAQIFDNNIAPYMEFKHDIQQDT